MKNNNTTSRTTNSFDSTFSKLNKQLALNELIMTNKKELLDLNSLLNYKKNENLSLVNDTPGPGYYNLPKSFLSTRSHIISRKSETRYITDTANVEFRTQRIFPESKKITIGSFSKDGYIPKNVSPAPNYVPPPFGFGKNIKISEKTKIIQDILKPGPTTYSPKFVYLKRSPQYVVPAINNKIRNKTKKSIPGPGTYDIIPPLKKAPKWSNKLRSNKLNQTIYTNPEEIVFNNDKSFISR